MAVRVTLSNGQEVLVQATLNELTDALQAAGQRGAMLKIEQPDGLTIAITPKAVETIQEDPEASAALEERFAEAAGAH